MILFVLLNLGRLNIYASILEFHLRSFVSNYGNGILIDFAYALSHIDEFFLRN
jgi:hypothetical protein